MIPISDENRGIRHHAWVNWSLIAINILVFLYELTLDQHELDRFVTRWGVVPRLVAHGHHLETLITCAFLHGGWLHIGGNMLFLWVFGDNIEDIMGHVQYLVFYLLCAVCAGLLQVFVDSSSTNPLVGASGAIAGVLAAYLVLFPKGKIRTLLLIGIPLIILLPAWIVIGIWIILQFISGVASLGVDTANTSGVAYFAHIGGFIAGAILVFVFRDRETHQQHVAARADNQAWSRFRLGSGQEAR